MLPVGAYNLVIEGFANSEGEYTVQMSCAALDRQVEGPITCGSSVTGSTLLNPHDGIQGSPSHYYSFSLTDVNNLVQFDSCNSDYDTFLRIYSSDLGTELEACDDCKYISNLTTT